MTRRVPGRVRVVVGVLPPFEGGEGIFAPNEKFAPHERERIAIVPTRGRYYRFERALGTGFPRPFIQGGRRALSTPTVLRNPDGLRGVVHL